MNYTQELCQYINLNSAASAYPVSQGEYFAPDFVVHNSFRAHSFLIVDSTGDTIEISADDIRGLFQIANRMTSVYLFVRFSRRHPVCVQSVNFSDIDSFRKTFINNLPDVFNAREQNGSIVLDKPEADEWLSARHDDDYKVVLEKLGLD